MKNYEKFLKSVPTPISYTKAFHCWLKHEHLLPSGSHKDRETVALSESLPATTSDLLCVTTGNAGISLAYYYGAKAHIVVPRTCKAKKIKRLKTLGADVIKTGQTYTEAWHMGQAIAQLRKWENVSPGCDGHVRAAADSEIGAEIMQQLQNVDYIFVPSANHTLATGIQNAVQRYKTKVVSVVLPNHPFLKERKLDVPQQFLKGYDSIATATEMAPHLEKLWLNQSNVITTTVPISELSFIRRTCQNRFLDLAVYLTLFVSDFYKGRKVVIATGVNRK